MKFTPILLITMLLMSIAGYLSAWYYGMTEALMEALYKYNFGYLYFIFLLLYSCTSPHSEAAYCTFYSTTFI